MEENEKRSYRFEAKIVDEETGDIIVSGSTYVGSISDAGECESIDMETGSMLRNFNRRLREEYEQQFKKLEPEEEEEQN